MRLLLIAGERCEKLMETMVRNVTDVQADENLDVRGQKGRP
jgi:hypothetical protein